MLTWRFAVQLNRSLMELVGLVVEKTEVVYLKSFSCVVVKKTYQVTCGVASFQIQKIVACRCHSGFGPPSSDLDPPNQTFL